MHGMCLQTHWPVGLPRDAPSPAAGPIPMDQRLPWDVSKFVDTWKVNVAANLHGCSQS